VTSADSSAARDEAKVLLKRYCRYGDQPAFTRFYQQHAGRLWRFLCARGLTADAAYDLLAEAFLRFIQVVCKDLRSPLALLYRIAVNLHIDTHRRATVASAAVNHPIPEPDGESQAAKEEHEYLRSLIATLPRDEQNLLLLRYWIGLTHREVAAILNLPEGTVRRQSAALIARLRQRWLEESRGS
jgi:RNA polymerase sigma-70 factor (ECF subfamily)